MKKYFVDQNIEVAETLPGRFYRDQETFYRLKDDIFGNCWHWLGDVRDLLPPQHNIRPITILENFLDEPVLLAKDKEQSVKCLSNVCTHRGNIIVHNSGKVKSIVCGYHGRSWNLDGQFKSMPEFEEVKNFPRECDHLHQFNLHQLGPYLFAGLGDHFPLDHILTIMSERVGFLPLHEFKADLSLSKNYIVNCHWALYCDNYLEGFHIPFIHNDLNTVLDYGNYETQLHDHMILQIGYADEGTDCFKLPEGHPDHGRHVAAYYYWLFPNMMFNFYPWGLSVNIVVPHTPNKTKVLFRSFVYDESLIEAGAGAALDKVEREDEFVVEAVNQGLKSKSYQTGRFSVTREQGVHHFQRLLASYC